MANVRVADDPPGARVQRGAIPKLSIYWNGMSTGISGFYDDFAPNYHLLFEDWEASIIRQAAAIESILERDCPAVGTMVLDCACGIGTQALGLANLVSR